LSDVLKERMKENGLFIKQKSYKVILLCNAQLYTIETMKQIILIRLKWGSLIHTYVLNSCSQLTSILDGIPDSMVDIYFRIEEIRKTANDDFIFKTNTLSLWIRKLFKKWR